MQVNLIMMFVFLGDGLICSIIAIILYIRVQDKLKSSFETDAEIIDLEYQNSSEGRMTYPVFKFKTGSHEYTVRNKYGRSPWNIKTGEMVRILYSQDNPQDAEIKNSLAQWMFPMFFAAGALLGFIMVPLMYFILK